MKPLHKIGLLAAMLWSAGCADVCELRVSPEFSDEDTEQIISAVDRWNATGASDCAVVLDSEKPNVIPTVFVPYTWYGFHREGIIYIAGPLPPERTTERVMLHELGHKLGWFRHHDETGIMGERHGGCISQVDLDYICDGCQAEEWCE